MPLRTRPGGRRIAAIIVGLNVSLVSFGCGSEPNNRSPLASDNPARYSLALEEDQRMAQSNRDAETAFYRRIGLRSDDLNHLTATSPAPDNPTTPHLSPSLPH